MKKQLILIFGLFILIAGLHEFWNGFHSADLSHNEEKFQNLLTEIVKEHNLTPYIITETDTGYNKSTLSSLYISGMSRVINGFYIAMVGMLIIGVSIKWK